MGMLTDYSQNFITDALFRGGALNAAGTVNSTATVTGVWTATTTYAVGQTVVPHALMTGAGGKFLRCTAITTGTSGSTNTLAVPAVGSTLVDGGATWTAVSGVPCPSTLYVALLTNTKGARANSFTYAVNDTISLTANDGKIHYYKCTAITTGISSAAQSTLYPGTANEVIVDTGATFTEQNAGLDSNSAIVVEASGTGYARVNLAAALANWAGTQAAASTTTSTGTLGTTSNNSAVTFGTPTTSWQPAAGVIWGFAVFDQLAGGNLLAWGPLGTVQTVLNGQAAPSFAISTLSMQIGN